VIGINACKVVLFLLLDFVLQVGDNAIGTHLHDEETPNSMLKVVIDKNAKHSSECWYCHASSSWVEVMMEGRREREWVAVAG
jgi:hypothetical protein